MPLVSVASDLEIEKYMERKAINRQLFKIAISLNKVLSGENSMCLTYLRQITFSYKNAKKNLLGMAERFNDFTATFRVFPILSWIRSH